MSILISQFLHKNGQNIISKHIPNCPDCSEPIPLVLKVEPQGTGPGGKISVKYEVKDVDVSFCENGRKPSLLREEGDLEVTERGLTLEPEIRLCLDEPKETIKIDVEVSTTGGTPRTESVRVRPEKQREKKSSTFEHRIADSVLLSTSTLDALDTSSGKAEADEEIEVKFSIAKRWKLRFKADGGDPIRQATRRLKCRGNRLVIDEEFTLVRTGGDETPDGSVYITVVLPPSPKSGGRPTFRRLSLQLPDDSSF